MLSQFREFERTVVTVLNAYLTPLVGRYMGDLAHTAARDGVSAPVYIMKSNGGVATVETAAQQAVYTVLSGPVAGVMGALDASTAANHPSFISLDVGGTSADICLVRDASPEMTIERMIGGLPLQTPMMDISTIGAAGGSIAHVTGTGGLAVGPRSAGADPGPACYGMGGIEPTVTDAHLVLGRLPDALIGGGMDLDREAAEEAIKSAVAEPLALSVHEAAVGIVEIVENNMAGAVRAVSIGRGHDPKDFALIAFGGAGPLHACRLASLLGIDTVIVPPRPGVLSTTGLLNTDLRNDHVVTLVRSLVEIDHMWLKEAYDRLESDAREWLSDQGMTSGKSMITRSADLRYKHQASELTVNVPDGDFTEETAARMAEAFHGTHLRLYTYDLPEAEVELVNLRVTAVGELEKHHAAGISSSRDAAPQPLRTRPVFFDRTRRFVDTPVFERGSLTPGMAVDGPAVIEQDDTTTLLWPGFIAQADGRGNLILKAVSS